MNRHSAIDLNRALQGPVRRLSHIQRYSSMPVIRGENVAEHSWQVAFYSYVIGQDLIARGYAVRLDVLLSRAILHDLSEAMSGDIIRSYKYGTEQMAEATAHADLANMKVLAEDFGSISGDILEDWETAKDSDLEGGVVRLADLLCVVTYCAEEYRMGNALLDHILASCYVNLLRPLRASVEFGCYIQQLFPTDRYTDAYRRIPANEGAVS